MASVAERSLAAELRDELDPFWQEISRHPFLVELEAGELPIEKYRTYATQNCYYLFRWISTFCVAASKCQDPSLQDVFVSMIVGFREEGEKFKELTIATGVTETELNSIKPLPSTLAYTDYLLRVAYQGTSEEFAAAMTSCPWTYAGREFGGLHIGPRMAHALETHYGVSPSVARHYGDNFLGGVFQESLEQFFKLISHDALQISPEARQRRRDLFTVGSNYEYKFWQAAYDCTPGESAPASFYA